MTDREAILTALPVGESTVRPLAAAEPQISEDLWERFARELRSLGGEIVDASVVERLADKRVWCDADARPFLPGTVYGTSDVWEAEVGITLADYAIAETGSLVLSCSGERARLASLAPPIHLAIVRRSAILGTLEEAVIRLSSRTSVLVTGTSRTADIEGILVRGIHGPGEVWVWVSDE